MQVLLGTVVNTGDTTRDHHDVGCQLRFLTRRHRVGSVGDCSADEPRHVVVIDARDEPLGMFDLPVVFDVLCDRFERTPAANSIGNVLGELEVDQVNARLPRELHGVAVSEPAHRPFTEQKNLRIVFLYGLREARRKIERNVSYRV
ncbi:hypothetical protein HRbin16_02440 [bacterium HR16]|nr:hypothetical protein HRbin16_02440 [bacterium HR16]